MEIADLWVYIDGKFVRGDEAKISVFDHGFLYGDGVFEGIREYNSRVFKLEEHLDRLFDSAKAVNLEIPLSRDELREVILETLRRNGLENAHMRPIVTRGGGAFPINGQGCKPSVIIFAHPLAGLFTKQAITLKTAGVRRIPPQCIDPKVKNLNYLNSVLAGQEALAAGADEALLLDMNGFVAEASGENIFLVKKGILSSPTTANTLGGITRQTVIELATQEGIKFTERNITLGEVYAADEVFLTGTGAELVAVSNVDGRAIGSVLPGPITARMRNLYLDLVRSTGTPVWN